MKISYKCDYALKIILDLAACYPDQLAQRGSIASRQDIPEKFLEQILRSLMDGGFVRSRKGRYGGYMLARPPQDITIGQVLRYIEGTLYPISCVDPKMPSTCDFIPMCQFYGIWKEVGDAVARIVDRIDFEQLRRKASAREETTQMYYI